MAAIADAALTCKLKVRTKLNALSIAVVIASAAAQLSQDLPNTGWIRRVLLKLLNRS